jgi:hypothetical protein
MNHLDPHYFIFQLPLYSKINFGTDQEKEFIDLMRFKGTINEYSPTLKENTTYRIDSNPSFEVNPAYNHYISSYIGFKSFALSCVRISQKMMVFTNITAADNGGYYIEKIGQSPSLADLQIAKIADYSRVLDNEKLKEFSKAIGLTTHGIGIGSFVYLRRIFEYLIDEAHIKAKTESNWDENTYNLARVNDKIKILSQNLPDFLVQNKELYSILSKGIHELTEDECLQNFDIVKVGIELILDEKLEVVNKHKKIEEVKQRIQATTKKLSF